VITLLHDTVYMFLHSLLNVLVQIANKMGFQKVQLITGRIFQALPPIGIHFLTHLFNAALILGYFPAQ
jgi:hypothetical protein